MCRNRRRGGAFTSAGGLTYLSTITDNVGIGTSTPYAKLTVWGGGEGTNTAFEVVNNSSTTLFSILENGKITLGGTTNGLVLHNISSNPSSPSSGEIYFNSTDNKAYVYNGSGWIDMTASSSGATAFGAYQNLVASSTAGADKTQVTITADYLTLIDPNDAVYQATNVNVTADITSSGANELVYVPDLIIDGLTNTDPLATDGAGKIVAGASDKNLKHNIKDLKNSLNKILKLQGVSFKYNKEVYFGDKIHFGLIGQDVKKVIPEIVKPRPKDEKHLTLSYIEIIPLLIESIK